MSRASSSVESNFADFSYSAFGPLIGRSGDLDRYPSAESFLQRATGYGHLVDSKRLARDLGEGIQKKSQIGYIF